MVCRDGLVASSSEVRGEPGTGQMGIRIFPLPVGPKNIAQLHERGHV